MKKALIITNTASMVHLFNSVNINILLNAGYEVHIACNFVYGNTVSGAAIEDYKIEWAKENVCIHQIGFLRSPFSLKSFKIYKDTKKLICEGDFDIIHCHTPIVSVFTRLAARKQRKNKTKVIYTAHGFHFFKGSPIFNWIVYYPIEKVLSYITDVLITITKEDYNRAKAQFKAKEIKYIEGIGVDVNLIFNEKEDRENVRKEFGIKLDDMVLISVGEINHNKNHRVVIRAIAECKNKNLHYILTGIGNCKDELHALAKKLGVEDRVHFAGFRTDVYRLLKACDIFLLPSHREGLSVALMEAMACSLPAIVSKIRGNTDLIDEQKGGIFIAPDDVNAMVEAIGILGDNEQLRTEMGRYNKEKVKAFDKSIVREKLLDTLCDIEKMCGEVGVKV